MQRYFVIFLVIAVILGALLSIYLKQRSKSKDHLVLYGNVDVRQVDLGFRVLGRVVTMPFQEGDLVTPGTLMGVLDKQPYKDQVLEALAALQGARYSLENAQNLLERRRSLISDGSVSKEDYENALTSKNVYEATVKQAEAALGVAQKNLEDTEVYAPAEGTILTRIREPGAVVNPAEPIYTLSLSNPVWVRAFVPEPYLGKIHPGMPAEVYTDSRPDFAYKGHIGFISPLAEFTPKTVETTQLRTDLVYRLRIIVDNPDLGLRQGMPVTVKLPLKEIP